MLKVLVTLFVIKLYAHIKIKITKSFEYLIKKYKQFPARLRNIQSLATELY